MIKGGIILTAAGSQPDGFSIGNLIHLVYSIVKPFLKLETGKNRADGIVSFF